MADQGANDLEYHAVSRRGSDPPGTRWNLDDVGLDRNAATAAMIIRAVPRSAWETEHLLTEILAGRADPEVPHLIADVDKDGGWWICIVREDRTPPEPHL